MKLAKLFIATFVLALASMSMTKTANAQTASNIAFSDFYFDYEVFIQNPNFPTGLWSSIGVYETYAEAVLWQDSMDSAGWLTKIESIYDPPIFYQEYQSPYFRNYSFRRD